MNQTNYYTSRRQQSWGRNRNLERYKSNIKLGPVAHTVLVALMITVLGLIYLTQATKATGYDYEIDKIDDQISALTLQQSDLEIENARLTSLTTAKNGSVARQMSTPESTEYIR